MNGLGYSGGKRIGGWNIRPDDGKGIGEGMVADDSLCRLEEGRLQDVICHIKHMTYDTLWL